jgi:putative iron-dependent peroxidase
MTSPLPSGETLPQPVNPPASVAVFLVATVDAWDALAVEAQEKVIGRTELTNLELDAPGSHKDVNTVLGPDGAELKILRSPMPFGRPGHGEFGTYFVAYAATPGIPETMLRKMFLGGPGAGPDPLPDYSRAVTGSLFLVPPAGFLEDLPDSG